MGVLGRRKAQPKHAMTARSSSSPPSSLRSSSTRSRRDPTSFLLVAVLVVTSGFVAGTTATFTASTRNAGNTFTVAGIFTPTSPSASISGTTVSFAWTNVNAGNAANAGVGYRVSRSSPLDPTDTGGTAPSCPGTGYSQIGYATGSPYADSAPAGVNQGQYLCYQAIGVYPCCPASGNIPIITSLQGAITTSQQYGYVVKSWSFTGNGDNTPTSGTDKLTINFNQDVAVSTSVSTSDTVCFDPQDKAIIIGASSTVADSCAWEVQTLAITCTSGNWKVSFNGSATSNLPCTTTTGASLQAKLQALGTVGSGNMYATGPVVAGNTSTYTVHFAGTLSGTQPVLALSNGAPGLGCSGCTAARVATEVFAGTAVGSVSASIGYLTNASAFTTSGNNCASGSCVASSRYAISAVSWTAAQCTTPGVACKQAVITLGANAGTDAVTLPTGTWTSNPKPAAGKTTAQGGGPTLCTTDPGGSPPTLGLCKPTSGSGW